MYEKFMQMLEGLITEQEFLIYCEEAYIFGELQYLDNKLRFIGHDYKNQIWVRFN